jgi:hypothetical protein
MKKRVKITKKVNSLRRQEKLGLRVQAEGLFGEEVNGHKNIVTGIYSVVQISTDVHPSACNQRHIPEFTQLSVCQESISKWKEDSHCNWLSLELLVIGSCNFVFVTSTCVV